MAETRSDGKLRILEARERSGETSKIGTFSGGAKPGGSHPDPEVPAKAIRRRFSAPYNLKILEQADHCQEGLLGALLRREGLYWSNLQTWRRQRDEGTLGTQSYAWVRIALNNDYFDRIGLPRLVRHQSIQP